MPRQHLQNCDLKNSWQCPETQMLCKTEPISLRPWGWQAASEIAADVTAYTKKKGRLRCHKRPKSREETPKEGSDSGIPLAKTIAISGSIERKGSRTDTKVYGARP
jgi:hypothetical protein